MPDGRLATETKTSRDVDWTAVMETALNSPGQLGSTYNRFHRYSFLNQVLLLAQGAHEPVASYARWQSLGRQVMKGERGYEIVRPITVKSKTETVQTENGEQPKTYTRFKLVRGAFTFSQTSGEELPEPALPSWDFERALGRLGITEVDYDHIDGNCQGYAAGMTIAVSPMAAYPVRTRLHEMAHVVLGHTTSRQGDVPIEEDRGFRELEAEGTAYLCMTELGLAEFFDAGESRAYIQGWLQGRRPPESSLRQIFKATNTILEAGYSEQGRLF